MFFCDRILFQQIRNTRETDIPARCFAHGALKKTDLARLSGSDPCRCDDRLIAPCRSCWLSAAGAWSREADQNFIRHDLTCWKLFREHTGAVPSSHVSFIDRLLVVLELLFYSRT